MKEAAARTIEKLGIEAIILHEQPSRNKTIIEKFEANSDVGFAVVLLSGDDMAYVSTIPHEKAQPRPRARQNVVLELGYFLGRLGREKVLALLKQTPSFELPSDYQGIVYVPFDDVGASAPRGSRQGKPIDGDRRQIFRNGATGTELARLGVGTVANRSFRCGIRSEPARDVEGSQACPSQPGARLSVPIPRW
jgi:Predicted nucleotide-binding protein containing TIR-like domain